ncbi:hypothetical protein IEQ34_012924 [Dendrobium chrysotoxum]|uniref:Uncharacterized protein n=1 Tax=Dendrobium chrysotoxum TaxID=161865 RepID=A0AAV7GQ90_DENCH|nr:hypothetical protein IEQ34_012924 [Dendrobium chrysotoxum]
MEIYWSHRNNLAVSIHLFQRIKRSYRAILLVDKLGCLLIIRWLTLALMDNFTRISTNEITILVNGAEICTDIGLQEAQKTLKIAEA